MSMEIESGYGALRVAYLVFERNDGRRWGSRWQARGVPPAIGMPIETPAKLRAFARTTK
jgi:hypothetical protein